jgi:hypothetical protein
MRSRAKQAGNLQSTPQESVTTTGQTIVIQPADPEVVYVPEYDPWDVYGETLEFYPDWVGVPGAFVGPGIAFGLGVGVGVFGGFGWGWHHWGADWHGREVLYNHNTYVSHSPTFINRDHLGDHGRFDRGPGGLDPSGFGHPGGGFAGHAPVGAGRAFTGDHSGAFSGFNHGGVANTYSSRGRSSFDGNSHRGGFHGGGGGGFHGGGGGGSHGGGGGHR